MFPHSGEELRQQCRSHGEKTEVQAQARQRQRRSRGGRSGGASAAESCGRPPRWTEVLRVLKDGEGGDEDQEDDDFFGLGAIVEVGCMHGHTGSRRNWRLECKASGWQGKVRPDCRPTSCEAPDDMFGVWVFQQGFNDTLSLVCSDGYSSEGGSRVLFCNETPWARERLAGCVPGTGSARRFRSGLKAGALFGLLGTATAAVVVVATFWREPPPLLAGRKGADSQEAQGALNQQSNPLVDREASRDDME
mmetsp:Transcript_76839/g.248884  ORF Transcript_76839/g.248884 Transcript_76839/m.248884 type:complete len:249 (+) Transcript_76839:116-862(+)